jgi:hypothetical protein
MVTACRSTGETMAGLLGASEILENLRLLSEI